ncbi:hypothetical protein EXIGLDRAFT_410305 [Exidia glandulosa HHB12029]|uniref:Uncharacterized protein n=1 Tax=Exidia glandulosa HHB12029 TaxID=1314781 RepID=A0A165BFW5_EXIGL|nr:hypothetical protein EXIGLDRAFT_410305 [Exidia glandulosa HHB12029]
MVLNERKMTDAAREGPTHAFSSLPSTSSASRRRPVATAWLGEIHTKAPNPLPRAAGNTTYVLHASTRVNTRRSYSSRLPGREPTLPTSARSVARAYSPSCSLTALPAAVDSVEPAGSISEPLREPVGPVAPAVRRQRAAAALSTGSHWSTGIALPAREAGLSSRQSAKDLFARVLTRTRTLRVSEGRRVRISPSLPVHAVPSPFTSTITSARAFASLLERDGSSATTWSSPARSRHPRQVLTLARRCVRLRMQTRLSRVHVVRVLPAATLLRARAPRHISSRAFTSSSTCCVSTTAPRRASALVFERDRSSAMTVLSPAREAVACRPVPTIRSTSPSPLSSVRARASVDADAWPALSSRATAPRAVVIAPPHPLVRLPTGRSVARPPHERANMAAPAACPRSAVTLIVGRYPSVMVCAKPPFSYCARLRRRSRVANATGSFDPTPCYVHFNQFDQQPETMSVHLRT